METLSELLDSAKPGSTLTGWHARGKLASYLPEVDRLFGVPQHPEYHPEVDTGVHVAMCLDVAHQLRASKRARFAVLVHDLGKALTPADELPAHVGHERRGLRPTQQVCDRLVVPTDWRKLALLVGEYHLHAHRVFEMRSTSVVKFLQKSGLDTVEPDFFEDFVIACEADKRGRTGRQEQPYVQGAFLRCAWLSVCGHPYPPGADMHAPPGEQVYANRIAAVNRVREHFREP